MIPILCFLFFFPSYLFILQKLSQVIDHDTEINDSLLSCQFYRSNLFICEMTKIIEMAVNYKEFICSRQKYKNTFNVFLDYEKIVKSQ